MAISLHQNNLVGRAPDTKDYDLFSVIFVGLSEEVVNESDEYRLHRLLETFFSSAMDEKEKRRIIEDEYGITYSGEIERSVSQMCNVSQGLIQKGKLEGMREGRLEGKLEGKIEMLYELNYTIEDISKKLEVSIDKVKQVIVELEK